MDRLLLVCVRDVAAATLRATDGTAQHEAHCHRRTGKQDRLIAREILGAIDEGAQIVFAKRLRELGQPAGTVFDQASHPRFLAAEIAGRLSRRVRGVLRTVGDTRPLRLCPRTDLRTQFFC
ncbi:MAG TPA: hypothetical protein VGI78_00455 [Acetobacteraceae bacterium]|jgi:hypothetical protein